MRHHDNHIDEKKGWERDSALLERHSKGLWATRTARVTRENGAIGMRRFGPDSDSNTILVMLESYSIIETHSASSTRQR